MSTGYCCMYFCFVTFGVYIDLEKKKKDLNAHIKSMGSVKVHFES